MKLGAMDIFKFLPAGKKQVEANCKKCGFPTCMMFAMKLSKNEAQMELCPHICDELKEKLEHNSKVQQIELTLGDKKIGGETVLYRHEKTFKNPTILAIKLNTQEENFNEKLTEIINFKYDIIGTEYKIDAIYLQNPTDEIVAKIKNSGIEILDDDFLTQMSEIEFQGLQKTLDELTHTRKEAILNRNENFSKPVYIKLYGSNIEQLCILGSSFICKYANLLIFDEFSKELFLSLISLRTNIYTDPQKPLQVEAGIYEFNNPDENALIFLTTNFALSYFSVANELSNLKQSSFLVITPSDGMSVLTAWSAQKITAQIAANSIKNNEKLTKVKNKQIIIPGLLSSLQEELQEELPEWKIVVGTTDAFKIPEFVENLVNS